MISRLLQLLYARKFLLSSPHRFGLPLLLIGTHRRNECTCYEQIAIPFTIGWHDIPGCFIRTALGERISIGLLVLVPVLALRPIGRREFPGLGPILLTSQEAFLLLQGANMQIELQNNHVILC